MDILIGQIASAVQLQGSVSGEEQLQGFISGEEQLKGSFDLFTLPEHQYEGSYMVTPTESEQVLPTSGRTPLGNIKVEPIPEQYIVPSGTISITQNGDTDVTSYATASVDVQPSLQDKSVTVTSAGNTDITADASYYGLSTATAFVPSGEASQGTQFGYTSSGTRWRMRGYNNVTSAGWFESGQTQGNWTTFYAVPSGTVVTPSESSQTVGGSDVMMRDAITINAIPSNYVGTGVPRNDDDSLSIFVGIEDAAVIASSGYYQSNAEKIIPFASISQSISYEQSTGVITATGTFPSSGYAVSGSSFSASSQIRLAHATLTSNGTYYAIDDDNDAWTGVTVSVAGGSASLYDGSVTIIEAGTEVFTPEDGYDGFSTFTTTVEQGYLYGTSTISCSPSISVSENGKITAGYYSESNIYPVYSTGWIESSQNLYTYITGNNEYQLSTQGASTITPSTASQTAVASGYFTTGSVTVSPIPSQYIVPSGTMSVSANGTYDIGSYASVNVSVSYIDGDSLSYGAEPLVGVAIVGQSALCEEE